MGAIVQLVSKPERLKADQAAELRQALLPFEEQMPGAVRALIAHIDRQTASKNRWVFLMISPERNAAVVSFLVEHSSRPLVAVRLWALCFEHLRADSGEIMLSRDAMAEALAERVENVSRIMGELEAFGAISRRRERVVGMKGPGTVRYFLSATVATHLSGRERDAAQSQAPKLKLVRGRDSAAPRP